MDRRRYLATLTALTTATIAGCTQLFGSSIERAGEEAWSNRETEQTATGEIIRGDIVLESNQYTDQGFFGVGAPTLAWQVEDVSDGSLDVWVVSEDEFGNFEDGNEFRYTIDLSEQGITSSGEAEGRVDGSEDWYVVFDNTGRESDADDRVEFSAAVGIGG
jgi:hypothetical protein